MLSLDYPELLREEKGEPKDSFVFLSSAMKILPDFVVVVVVVVGRGNAFEVDTVGVLFNLFVIEGFALMAIACYYALCPFLILTLLQKPFVSFPTIKTIFA